MAKRLYASILGIPLWIILGLSFYLLASASYDFMVGDRTTSRYIVIGISSSILIIATVLQMVSLKTIIRIAKNQIGG